MKFSMLKKGDVFKDWEPSNVPRITGLRAEDPLEDDEEEDEGGEGGSQQQSGGMDDELKQTLQSIATGLQNLGQRQDSLEQMLQSNQVEQYEDDDDGEEDEDEPDLESMDRREFANHLLKQIRNTIKKEDLKPVQEQVTQTSQQQIREQTRDDIEKASESHPDFWDWHDEIKAKAQELPQLMPSQIYHIVRGENPEKAQRLEKYYASQGDGSEGSGDDEGKGSAKKSSKKGGYGGMTPSGGGKGSAKKNDGRMTRDEAVERAWDDAMQGVDLGEGE